MAFCSLDLEPSAEVLDLVWSVSALWKEAEEGLVKGLVCATPPLDLKTPILTDVWVVQVEVGVAEVEVVRAVEVEVVAE